MLLKTRKWLLEKHVCVELAREWSDVFSLVEKQACDLVILCHTLQPEERQNAIHLLTTSSPRSKLICLVPIFEQPVQNSSKDACIPIDSSAHTLASMVKSILEPLQTEFPA